VKGKLRTRGEKEFRYCDVLLKGKSGPTGENDASSAREDNEGGIVNFGGLQGQVKIREQAFAGVAKEESGRSHRDLPFGEQPVPGSVRERNPEAARLRGG